MKTVKETSGLNNSKLCPPPPLVTVVTATLNIIKAGRAELFKESMNSIHAQTYTNIEHIIIDGASTDGTLDLIQEYVDKGWVKCYSEPDIGFFDPYNKGILKAHGKYISFMSTDDMYAHNDAIRMSVEALENEQADWSYGDTYLHNYETGKLVYWVGTTGFIPFGFFPCHQSLFVKKSVFKELGLFDLKYKNEDNHYMMKMIAAGYKSVKVPTAVCVFREGGWSAKTANLVEGLHVEMFYNLFGKKLGLTQKECASLYSQKCFYTLSPADFAKIGLKLQDKDWVKNYISKEPIPFFEISQKQAEPQPVIKSSPVTVSKAYFCRLPLFKIKTKKGTSRITVFGLPVLKLKRRS